MSVSPAVIFARVSSSVLAVSAKPVPSATAAASAAIVLVPVVVAAVVVEPAVCSACLAVASAASTKLVIAVIPSSAARSVCTALPTKSCNRLRSLALLFNADAVKKAVGSSSALFTFNPVASFS